MHVWDYRVDNDLKELIGTYHTNKMHILFGSLSLKNFTIRRVWLWEILRWVTFEEISQEAYDWEQNMLKSHVLICGDNHWSSK